MYKPIKYWRAYCVVDFRIRVGFCEGMETFISSTTLNTIYYRVEQNTVYDTYFGYNREKSGWMSFWRVSSWPKFVVQFIGQDYLTDNEWMLKKWGNLLMRLMCHRMLNRLCFILYLFFVSFNVFLKLSTILTAFS